MIEFGDNAANDLFNLTEDFLHISGRLQMSLWTASGFASLNGTVTVLSDVVDGVGDVSIAYFNPELGNPAIANLTRLPPDGNQSLEEEERLQDAGGALQSTTDEPDDFPPQSNESICENTGFWSFNMICDDGGPGAVLAEHEYGRDCGDCGPRRRLETSLSTPPSPTREGASYRKIELHRGWNWVSFDLGRLIVDVGEPLSGMQRIEDLELIKSQDGQFAAYLRGRGLIGTLRQLHRNKAYKMKVRTAQPLVYGGGSSLAPDVELPLTVGWNWLPCLLPADTVLNEALPQHRFVDGDFLKSKDGKVAFFSNGHWRGNLNVLQPGQGYMLRVAKGGMATIAP